MTQDDVYRKVGRGGAGNFYSASRVRVHDDDTATAASTSPVNPLPSAHARVGRGGAGNFVDTTTTTITTNPTAQQHEGKVADQTTAAVKKQPSRGPGLSGRGGAGNWKTDAAALEAKRSAEERGRGEELERRVREAVDQGLRLPDKVHHALEKTNTE